MPPFGSRRAFLQSSTLGASALAAGTWQSGMLYAADARSSPGPNETVNLGVIGSGGRAGQVMKRMNQVSGTRLIAVADVEDARMDRFNKTFGDGKARHYSDYRKLLEDKDVDAVLVATPGHWHVLPTIHACQAGKDVYVEKPLAHCIAEGRAAVEAAKKYNRVVQIGTQQASWEHYQRAAEIVRSGKLGPITEVKVWDMDYHYPGYGNVADSEPPAGFDWDFWLGPAPKAPYNENRHRHHYWFFDYGNGWQVDWAVHHYQIVHWFMNCDMPLSAVGVGSRYALEDNCQWPDTFSGVCEYPSCGPAPRGFLLQYTFRCCNRTEQRSHCKQFFGTEASMIVDRSGYTVYAEARGGKKLGDVIETFRSPTDNHAQVFIDCVRSRSTPPADVEVGHRAGIPGLLMNISWKTGRRICWDGQSEQVVGDAEANALVSKEYRAPWKLEV